MDDVANLTPGQFWIFVSKSAKIMEELYGSDDGSSATKMNKEARRRINKARAASRAKGYS